MIFYKASKPCRNGGIDIDSSTLINIGVQRFDKLWEENVLSGKIEQILRRVRRERKKG